MFSFLAKSALVSCVIAQDYDFEQDYGFDMAAIEQQVKDRIAEQLSEMYIQDEIRQEVDRSMHELKYGVQKPANQIKVFSAGNLHNHKDLIGNKFITDAFERVSNYKYGKIFLA
jgi:hypothetical protein